MNKAEMEQEKRTPKHRTPVQIGVSLQIYKLLRERATAEGLPLAAWLRRLALKELSRKLPARKPYRRRINRASLRNRKRRRR
jgi:hypothetical protein